MPQNIYISIQVLLDTSKFNTKISIELFKALKLCFNKNYLQFTSKYPAQGSELQIRSPLNSLLANIVITNIEQQRFNTKESIK